MIAILLVTGTIFVRHIQSEKQSTTPKVLGAFNQRDANSDINAVQTPSASGPQKVYFNVKSIGEQNAPDLNAHSILVYTPQQNTILYSKNVNDRLPIASLTKLMTALVASQQANFDRPITIAKDDLVNTEPSLHLQTGDVVDPKDLLRAMLIGSANDAALTLANHFGVGSVGGDSAANPDAAANPVQNSVQNFLDKMNAEAKYLGMNDTNYTTPIGFDTPGNYSTAYDLQKLVNYVLPNLPISETWQKDSYSFKSLNGNYYHVRASNTLLFSHSNIRSIKTGLTPEAKGDMIVQAGSKNKEIIAIVLGSDDRNKDTLSIVDYIFNNFSWLN